MLERGRVHLNTGLDAAVHDALVAFSSTKTCVLSGFLAGVISAVVLLPILLFYHTCYLVPRRLLLQHYLSGASGPLVMSSTCKIQTFSDRMVILALLPLILGAVAALFGYWRRRVVRDELHYKWRFPLSLHQTLAISAGYLFYLSICLINRSFLPISAAPLLAIAFGPAMWGIWQLLQNRLLTYMSKPTWENLLAETVSIWFQRRIGITADDIIAIRATPEGLLELRTRFTPEAAEQARLLGPVLPGISRVEVRDPMGAIISPLAPQSRLTSSLEAGRLVAEIRRQRANMFSAEEYQARPIRVHDASVRRLKMTALAVAIIFMASMSWVALRGGFKRLTAEDLAWYFGKYGNTSSPRLRLPGMP